MIAAERVGAGRLALFVACKSRVWYVWSPIKPIDEASEFFLIKEGRRLKPKLLPKVAEINKIALEPIREVSIHDEELATRRLSMMRIMARWMKARRFWRSARNRVPVAGNG
jgi:hypothetical protein